MSHEIRLTDVSASSSTAGCGCGGGGACACGHHGAGHGARHGAAAAPAGQRFEVTGMTCGHCVSSVTEELSALGGVERVEVDLVPDAASTVTVVADRPLTRDEVRAAVEDAGYALAR